VADLEYILGWTESRSAKAPAQLSLAIGLSDDEQKIADVLLDKGSLIVDEIAMLTGLPQSKLAVNILGMEMRGLIISLPGKVYKLG
jgi:DNA processing protein